MAQQILSTNTFTTAKWIVSPTASDGTHTTIATALTSASSGDTIFIRPGTYTEDPTLKAGVNLTAYPSDCSLNGTGNVIIIGNCTLTGAGSVTISGIQLQTNSKAILSVTGSAASVVNLIDCYLNMSNNTGITFSSSSASAAINIYNCNGDLGTTGIAIFAHSSAGTMALQNCFITNSGGSSTANTLSAGALTILGAFIHNPITGSSTASFSFDYLRLTTASQNVIALTVGNSGAAGANFSNFLSGTASAISISQTLNLYNSQISSSNTNAITGGGTINYSANTFASTSSKNNVTTLGSFNMHTGGISFDGGTNTLSTYTEGTYTPTMVGTVVGTTTYTQQNGYYRRIGNLVTIQGAAIGTGATGTGSIVLGSFPFTIKNQTNGSPSGAMFDADAAGFTFPAGTTCQVAQGLINTTTANIYCSGTGTTGGAKQMANTNFNMQYTLTYEI